jgi:folate-dependent phosphoribosylglycinamide formyltransferase PurN
MSYLNLSDYPATKKSFTCYLIGQENLLVECARILRSRSFSILGIISPSDHIRQRMQEEEINCFESILDIDWQESSAGYLFSIVNNEIIPSGVLSQIRHLAINYHDAPLPRYAGSNATSWAILNGEQNHAVSWHVINECIDGGDILKQYLIPLQPDETALSLNFKCAEQAVASFSELGT